MNLFDRIPRVEVSHAHPWITAWPRPIVRLIILLMLPFVTLAAIVQFEFWRNKHVRKDWIEEYVLGLRMLFLPWNVTNTRQK